MLWFLQSSEHWNANYVHSSSDHPYEELEPQLPAANARKSSAGVPKMKTTKTPLMLQSPLMELWGAKCFAVAPTQVSTGRLRPVLPFLLHSWAAGVIPAAVTQHPREQEDAPRPQHTSCSTSEAWWSFPAFLLAELCPLISEESAGRHKSKHSQFKVGKKGKTLENDERG